MMILLQRESFICISVLKSALVVGFLLASQFNYNNQMIDPKFMTMPTLAHFHLTTETEK